MLSIFSKLIENENSIKLNSNKKNRSKIDERKDIAGDLFLSQINNLLSDKKTDKITKKKSIDLNQKLNNKKTINFLNIFRLKIKNKTDHSTIDSSIEPIKTLKIKEGFIELKKNLKPITKKKLAKKKEPIITENSGNNLENFKLPNLKELNNIEKPILDLKGIKDIRKDNFEKTNLIKKRLIDFSQYYNQNKENKQNFSIDNRDRSSYKVEQKIATKQIEQNLLMMKKNNQHHIKIKLNPKHLGEVSIKMVGSKKGLKVILNIENQDTFQMVQQQENDLKSLVASLKKIDPQKELEFSFSDSNKDEGEFKRGKSGKKGQNGVDWIEEETVEYAGIIEIVV